MLRTSPLMFHLRPPPSWRPSRLPSRRAGPQVVRGTHDGPRAAERLDVHHLRAARARRCSPSRRRPTSAPPRTRRARPAWRTCSSTWPSRATTVVGTTDYAKEKPALEAMEAAYLALQRARDAPRSPTRRRSRRCTKAVRGRAGRRAAVRQAERVRRADLARGRRRAQRRAPARTARPTTTTCPRTSSSSSPTSSPSASRRRSSASSTRSATS